MRRLLLPLVLALSACAAPTYNATEVREWAAVAYAARSLSSQCADPAAIYANTEALQELTNWAAYYSELHGGEGTAEAAKLTQSHASELKTAYIMRQPSEAYCLLKLQVIEQGARAITTSLLRRAP